MFLPAHWWLYLFDQTFPFPFLGALVLPHSFLMRIFGPSFVLCAFTCTATLQDFKLNRIGYTLALLCGFGCEYVWNNADLCFIFKLLFDFARLLPFAGTKAWVHLIQHYCGRVRRQESNCAPMSQPTYAARSAPIANAPSQDL